MIMTMTMLMMMKRDSMMQSTRMKSMRVVAITYDNTWRSSWMMIDNNDNNNNNNDNIINNAGR